MKDLVMKDRIQKLIDYIKEKESDYIALKMEELDKKRRSSLKGWLHKLIVEDPVRDKRDFRYQFLWLPVDSDEIKFAASLFPKEEMRLFLQVIQEEPDFNRKSIFERNVLSIVFKSNSQHYEQEKKQCLEELLTTLYEKKV